MRIAGWMGRADQTTKIKGMFVRPEQVADLGKRLPEAGRIRIEATREGASDHMIVNIETDLCEPERYETAVVDVLKLRGEVKLVPPGSLPNDGKVIDDTRDYG
jgi:phenylacetate-CoA ligase